MWTGRKQELIILYMPMSNQIRLKLYILIHWRLQYRSEDLLVVLQLFARELAAGWTSIGNQVLQFQERHLFRESDSQNQISGKWLRECADR